MEARWWKLFGKTWLHSDVDMEEFDTDDENTEDESEGHELDKVEDFDSKEILH